MRYALRLLVNHGLRANLAKKGLFFTIFAEFTHTKWFLDRSDIKNGKFVENCKSYMCGTPIGHLYSMVLEENRIFIEKFHKAEKNRHLSTPHISHAFCSSRPGDSFSMSQRLWGWSMDP